jgi:small GTP-binding protein
MSDIFEVRILVVGEVDSGKTSLIQRFANNSFSAVYTPSIGCKMSERHLTLECTGNKFHVFMWDICGNRSYESVNNLYYKSCSSVMIVVDAAQPEPGRRDSIMNHLVKIRERCGSIPVVIVMSKSDKLDPVVATCRKIAYEPGVPVISVSAKNGTNITHAFQLLLKEFLRHQQLVGVRVDVPVHRLRDITN